VTAAEGHAYFAGRLATGLVDVTSDLSALDSRGWWAVVVTFEGEVTCARFDTVRTVELPAGGWPGVPLDSWRSTMDRADYVAAVSSVRERIATGEVYQANICRLLEAPLPGGADLAGLARLLATGNPAPYQGLVDLPDHGVGVVSASPERFLRRDGATVTSSPIKGTGRTVVDLTGKDEAENVMIVDLVRNDLGRVCTTGTVAVADLLEVEEHPGLVHLVSTVRGELADGTSWPDIMTAAFPPGSVSGAPKSSALRVIADLEPTARGAYCGAVGWVDADRRHADLAVGIRTFERSDGMLRFGTGAGITWGSDPEREWAETELKAARLVRVAAERSQP
jgi:para-aminobenzoate synthetase component 1